MTHATRRTIFGAAAIAAAGAAAMFAKKSEAEAKEFPFSLSDQEWRARLNPEAYRVLRGHGTERAGTSPLDREKRQGIFTCAGCGNALFDAATKFDSRTGWPSFFQPIDGAVGTTTDRSFFMTRTEVHCANCGGHLGHVFPDGPPPTGQRYCMNGVAMGFTPKTGAGA